MKTVSFWCLIICAMFNLAGCGGGGGTGGGAGRITNPSLTFGDTTFTTVGAVSKDMSEITAGTLASLEAGITVSDGNNTLILEKGSIIVKRSGGSILVYESGENKDIYLDTSGHLIGVLPSTPELQAFVDDVVASQVAGNITNGILNPGQSRTFTAEKAAIMLNGVAPLQYSTFGLWAFNGRMVGDVSKTHQVDRDAVHPWWVLGGVDAYKKVPTVSTDFTGEAMALAFHISDDILESQYYFGDAKLSIGASLANVDLTLTFPEYYIITASGFSINSTTGEWLANPTIGITENNLASGGIGLDFGYYNSVWNNVTNPTAGDPQTAIARTRGNFYGSGANASEAVGAVWIDKNIKDDVDPDNIHRFGIYATFGVTKNP